MCSSDPKVLEKMPLDDGVKTSLVWNAYKLFEVLIPRGKILMFNKIIGPCKNR